MKEVRGIIASLPTPFTPDNNLDEEGLRTNVKFLIENRVHALAPATTTGEFWALTEFEYKREIEIVVDEANGKVPVIAGVGSNNTQIAIELAKIAKNAGSDGIFVVPPYYNRPTQEGLYRHFKTILDAVDIPTIIYNEPLRAAVNMSVDVVCKLYEEYNNLIGLKEADLNQLHQDIALTKGKLPIYVIDIALLSGLVLGGAGAVSVAANIVPKEMVQLYEDFIAKKFDEAKKIHYFLLPLFEGGVLFLETNPGPLKEAMNTMGLAAGNPRLPLVRLSEPNKTKLLKTLIQLNLLKC
jgi:4-hydroxy-tetrahydrodipicolinate synthase